MLTTEPVDFSTINRRIRDGLKRGTLGALAAILRPLNPADIIEHLEVLNSTETAIVYRLLDKSQSLTVFQELDARLQADLLRSLQDEAVLETFSGMHPAERVALLDELPATVATNLMRQLDPTRRAETSLLLGYPEDSAGRTLSTDFVTLYPELTVGEALVRIHPYLGDADPAGTFLVVDHGRRLLGAVKLAHLVSAERNLTVERLMTSWPEAQVLEPQQDAARRLIKRKAELLPVLDQERRLVGVLRWSDALQILDDAEEVRTARSAGSEPLHRPYLSTPIRTMVRSRVIWLLVLAIGASLTVQVLSSFEQTLESMVVLSLFIPLIVGIGGNTGNQAATTVTRALAMGEVRTPDLARVLLREVRIGAVLGTCLGMIGFTLAGLIFDGQVALIIGLTLVALCTIAAGVGGVMPMVGKMLRVDPAVFSNPFISTFVDAAGLIIYLSIAVAVLGA